MEAEIYERFEKLCMSETFDIINEYIKKFNVDINYDNGYYLELICERNDIDLLRKFIGLGGNIHLNNEGPLRLVAHEGYILLLDYLINECHGDYKILFNSSACSNKRETKEYLTNFK